jgi:formate--tetrahydrofolate ligase
MDFPSDLEIARGAALKPLEDIADAMGIGPRLLEPHGEEVVKIKLDAIAELADRPAARYVVVSAITPTPLGEGKTTTTVGLGQGFKHIGKRATVAIRQPSMGPRSASRAARPAAGTARSSPWRRSTCT